MLLGEGALRVRTLSHPSATMWIMSTTQQFEQLIRPVPPSRIKVKEGSDKKPDTDYTPHSYVVQKLLAVVGPFSWSVGQFIYDGDELSGCVGTLTVEVDGRTVSVSGVGDAEGFGSTNGDWAKNAESDAFKRAAMKLGIALELWCKEDGDFWIWDWRQGQKPFDEEPEELDPPKPGGDGIDTCPDCGKVLHYDEVPNSSDLAIYCPDQKRCGWYDGRDEDEGDDEDEESWVDTPTEDEEMFAR